MSTWSLIRQCHFVLHVPANGPQEDLVCTLPGDRGESGQLAVFLDPPRRAGQPFSSKSTHSHFPFSGDLLTEVLILVLHSAQQFHLTFGFLNFIHAGPYLRSEHKWHSPGLISTCKNRCHCRKSTVAWNGDHLLFDTKVRNWRKNSLIAHLRQPVLSLLLSQLKPHLTIWEFSSQCSCLKYNRWPLISKLKSANKVKTIFLYWISLTSRLSTLKC